MNATPEFGFVNLPFVVSTFDGRHFKLHDDATYIAKDGRLFMMPEGAETDGASTPAVLWEKFDEEWLPPFGTYWPAAVLHDCAYRNTLMVMNTIDSSGDLVKANLTKKQCDDLLKEAMESLGTHRLSIDEIYEGVVLGGKSSFEKDRGLES